MSLWSWVCGWSDHGDSVVVVMIHLSLVVLDLLWGLVVVVDGWSVLIVEWIGMLGLVSVKSQVG